MKIFQELSVVVSFAEFFILHQLLMKGDGGFNSFNNIFSQGTFHFCNGLFASAGNGNQFGNH